MHMKRKEKMYLHTRSPFGASSTSIHTPRSENKTERRALLSSLEKFCNQDKIRRRCGRWINRILKKKHTQTRKRARAHADYHSATDVAVYPHPSMHASIPFEGTAVLLVRQLTASPARPTGRSPLPASCRGASAGYAKTKKTQTKTTATTTTTTTEKQA